MRVLVAGATQAKGKRLAPRLVGAAPAIADALDRGHVEAAVREAKPDVIVHQLTAVGHVDTRHFDGNFAAANRLRIEGADNLLAVGVRRFVAQSNGAFTYARTGAPVKNEEDPLVPSPVRKMTPMIAAMADLEAAPADGERHVRMAHLRLTDGWFAELEARLPALGDECHELSDPSPPDVSLAFARFRPGQPEARGDVK